MRKKERGGENGREGRGRGHRDGRESLGGKGGRERGSEKGRAGEGKFRGARPPKYFFLEPRLYAL